jgi:hypothetical protein
MADATLLELLKEVRWKTLKLLEGVDEKQALFAPAGTNNHILWHAGHAWIVVESLGMGTRQADFPAGWLEKFGMNSKPATVTSWPALSEVVAALTQQRTRVGALIEALTAEQLDRVVGEPPRNRTRRGMILHGLHDEAGHQGEIYLLKKLWKVRG